MILSEKRVMEGSIPRGVGEFSSRFLTVLLCLWFDTLRSFYCVCVASPNAEIPSSSRCHLLRETDVKPVQPVRDYPNSVKNLKTILVFKSRNASGPLNGIGELFFFFFFFSRELFLRINY